MIDSAATAIDQWDTADKTLAVLPFAFTAQSAGLPSKI